MRLKLGFVPVIALGAYGILASLLMLDEYLDYTQLLKILCPCSVLYRYVETYLAYATIMGLPAPLISMILFACLTGLSVLGLLLKDSRSTTILLLILLGLSLVGVGGGLYLLYAMIYVLKTLCFICLSMDATLWCLFIYLTFKLLKT